MGIEIEVRRLRVCWQSFAVKPFDIDCHAVGECHCRIREIRLMQSYFLVHPGPYHLHYPFPPQP